jgi:hypothetical protein
MLRKYVHDPSHVLKVDTSKVKLDLFFEEKAMAILDRRVQELRNKTIPLVLVQWQHH